MTDKQYQKAMRLLTTIAEEIYQASEKLAKIEKEIQIEKNVDDIYIFSSVYEEMCDEMEVSEITLMGIS
jgi:intergrase/recombinase